LPPFGAGSIINVFEAQTIIGTTDVVPFTQTPYLVSQIAGHTYQWTATGGAIASGQGTNFVNVVWSNTGPYSIQLIESDGVCSDVSVLDLGVVTGVNKEDNNGLSIFPNPASDYISIRGLGENARAALMTRGFVEMQRMAQALEDSSLSIDPIPLDPDDIDDYEYYSVGLRPEDVEALLGDLERGDAVGRQGRERGLAELGQPPPVEAWPLVPPRCRERLMGTASALATPTS
jgi:hypothetical protein